MVWLIGCYRTFPAIALAYTGSSPNRAAVGGTTGPCGWGYPSRMVTGPHALAYLTNDVIWIAEPDGNRRGGSIGLPLDGSPGALCWSRDGHYVLYTWVLYETQTTRYGIGRVAADTIGQRNWEGGETLLLPEGQGARWPAVSPDGRRLAWCGIAHDGASQTEATAICWIPWEDLRWGGGAGTPPPMQGDDLAYPESILTGIKVLIGRLTSMRIGSTQRKCYRLRTAWVADLVADSVDEITIGAHATRRLLRACQCSSSDGWAT